MTQLHPDDRDTWNEMIAALSKGETPNLASKKRKRAIAAVGEYLKQLEGK